MSKGDLLESLSQQILVVTSLVGRLGATQEHGAVRYVADGRIPRDVAFAIARARALQTASAGEL